MSNLDLRNVLDTASQLERAGALDKAFEVLQECRTKSGPLIEWVWFEAAQKARKLGLASEFVSFSDLFLSSNKIEQPSYKNGLIAILRNRVSERSLPLEVRIRDANHLLDVSATERDVALVCDAQLGIQLRQPQSFKAEVSLTIDAPAKPLRTAELLSGHHYILELAKARKPKNIGLDVCKGAQYFSTLTETAIINDNRFFDGLNVSISLAREYERAKERLICPAHLNGRALVLNDYFGSGNYCHFLLDWMSRFVVANEYYGPIDYVCARVEKSELHMSIVNAVLGRTGARLIIDQGTTWLSFDEIVTAKNRDVDSTHPAFWGHPDATDRLRSQVFEHFKIKNFPKKRRILISRSDAGGRRAILNEEEVNNVLEPFGFERVVLSELTFEDQVRMFSEAQAVVGVHGAGLTNVLYLPPGAVVLELLHCRYGTPAFYRLSSTVDARYALMVCGSKKDEDVEQTRAQYHTNDWANASVWVDPIKLKEFFTQNL